jgi:xylulokinase
LLSDVESKTTGAGASDGAGPVTIGIDIGTTAVKALAVDGDGRSVAAARIEHPVLTPEAEILEHDACLAWRDGVLRAACEVAEAAVEAGCSVAAVEVDAMVPSLCAVDADGVPVSHGMLYGDRRAAEAATASGYAPSRGANPSEDGELVRMLAWLAERHPEAAGFWPAQAVANKALGGVGVLDSVTAMTTLPLFDFTGWDPGVCEDLGILPAQLPGIASGSGAIGTVGDHLPEALAGAVLGPGTIDAFAEQLVAGADDDGDVLVIIGGTLITWAVVPEWTTAPGLWTIPHSAPGKTLIGGPSNAGGIARDWAEEVLRSEPPPGPDGATTAAMGDVPVFLPHLRGERVPLHDPHRRGGFHDLSVAQGPAEMWRALYEASGFTVRRNLELAGLLDGSSGTRARRIVATGGGSFRQPWVQAIADATGLPVDCVAEPYGAALGTAFLARVAAGLEPDSTGSSRWAGVRARVEPIPEWREGCERRYRRFVELSGPPFERAPDDSGT